MKGNNKDLLKQIKIITKNMKRETVLDKMVQSGTIVPKIKIAQKLFKK